MYIEWSWGEKAIDKNLPGNRKRNRLCNTERYYVVKSPRFNTSSLKEAADKVVSFLIEI